MKQVITAILFMFASTQASAQMKHPGPQQAQQQAGSLEKKAFLRQMEQHFDNMDANHDGILTIEEMQRQSATIPGNDGFSAPANANQPAVAPAGR